LRLQLQLQEHCQASHLLQSIKLLAAGMYNWLLGTLEPSLDFPCVPCPLFNLQVVTDFCSQHLPRNTAAFKDPRMKLINDDARTQLEVGHVICHVM
jgi:hypothetical protein